MRSLHEPDTRPARFRAKSSTTETTGVTTSSRPRQNQLEALPTDIGMSAMKHNSWHSSPANDTSTRLDRAELRIAALEAASTTTNGQLEVLASELKTLAAGKEDPARHTDVAEMKWMVTSLAASLRHEIEQKLERAVNDTTALMAELSSERDRRDAPKFDVEKKTDCRVQTKEPTPGSILDLPTELPFVSCGSQPCSGEAVNSLQKEINQVRDATMTEIEGTRRRTVEMEKRLDKGRDEWKQSVQELETRLREQVDSLSRRFNDVCELPPRRWVVRIDRSQSAPLGLDLTDDLEIVLVKPEGLVQDWNSANTPEAALLMGDRIISVNGKTNVNGSRATIEELKTAQVLEIEVHRDRRFSLPLCPECQSSRLSSPQASMEVPSPVPKSEHPKGVGVVQRGGVVAADRGDAAALCREVPRGAAEGRTRPWCQFDPPSAQEPSSEEEVATQDEELRSAGAMSLDSCIDKQLRRVEFVQRALGKPALAVQQRRDLADSRGDIPAPVPVVDESSIFSRSPSFRERLEAQMLRVEFLHKIIGGRKPSQMTFEPASDTDGLERHTEGGLPGVSRRKQELESNGTKVSKALTPADSHTERKDRSLSFEKASENNSDKKDEKRVQFLPAALGGKVVASNRPSLPARCDEDPPTEAEDGPNDAVNEHVRRVKFLQMALTTHPQLRQFTAEGRRASLRNGPPVVETRQSVAYALDGREEQQKFLVQFLQTVLTPGPIKKQVSDDEPLRLKRGSRKQTPFAGVGVVVQGAQNDAQR